jgi:CheY-like chemotaxis protein/HPt (histidine-containing phosphotransfer) domain-containing protein
MAQSSSPIRVLVVDDDEMSRELLTVLLDREGYATSSADCGETALALLDAESSTPDVVLADMHLPGVSGAELARELRRACGPESLLLAISGSQPDAEAMSLFDGFLLKPFRMEDVAAALSQSRKHRNADLHADMEGPTDEDHDQSKPATALPVLNETIYDELAGSVPGPQLREMYMLCVNDARKRISAMRRHAADLDSAQFTREAHAIKGGAGMLGATELHRRASELEFHGLAGGRQAEAQNVNSLDELSDACDRLERMLGSRL